MIKVFVSQPMKGLSDEDILFKRAELLAIARRNVRAGALMNIDRINPRDEVVPVDSFFKDAPDEDVINKPVSYLGDSIKKLSEADAAIFAENWESARGCKIEHEICTAYNIPIIKL